MKLDKTVDMMLSDDYEERFKAEYHQLVYRRNRLKKVIRESEESTFKPDCSIDLLVWQLKTMDEYIYILKRRADIEDIEL